MGLNYPIIPQTRVSPGEEIRQRLREKSGQVWRGWMAVRSGGGSAAGGLVGSADARWSLEDSPDNKSQDDTFYRSIAARSFLRSSSKPDPGEKARAFSKEITSAAGRELASSLRRRQSITLGTRPSPRLTLPPRSLACPTRHLPRRKPSHTSTYTPEPATAFILVRSFLLSSTPLQIAPISRAVNFIFPRHFSLAAPHRVDLLSRPHGLSIFEKLQTEFYGYLRTVPSLSFRFQEKNVTT